jgi:hypothetical protein
LLLDLLEEEEELLLRLLLLLLPFVLLLLLELFSFPLLLLLFEGLFSALLLLCFSSERVDGAATRDSCWLGGWGATTAVGSCFLARTRGSRIRGSRLSLSLSAACNQGGQKVPLRVTERCCVAGRFFVSPKPLSLGLLLVWSWAKKNLQFPTGTINKVMSNVIII